jgi:hypothetical protein
MATETPSYVTRSINIRAADGNDISVSETAERNHVVISIQQNDEKGQLATVRLTRPQFGEFCRSRYVLEVKTDLKQEAPLVEI